MEVSLGLCQTRYTQCHKLSEAGRPRETILAGLSLYLIIAGKVISKAILLKANDLARFTGLVIINMHKYYKE